MMMVGIWILSLFVWLGIFAFERRHCAGDRALTAFMMWLMTGIFFLGVWLIWNAVTR